MLKAINSPAAQAFGRFIFQVDRQQLCDYFTEAQHSTALEGNAFFLKWQRGGYSDKHARSFLHELACYQHFSTQQASNPKTGIVLPFTVLTPTAGSWMQHCEGALCKTPQDAFPVLCVAAATALFRPAPDQLSDDACVHRLIQSLNVLQNLHALGLVHGDLKIQHFRTWQQRAYLIDFEQCKPLGHSNTNTHTATPRYMAPELFHAQAKSQASDIYALGVIWQMWLNQIQPADRDYREWAIWHCQQSKVTLVDRFSHWLPVLEGMLHKNKAHRYADISEIKQGLINLL